MIRYSTVQWCPRPDRGEFVNVAMLAWEERDTGKFEARVSNFERANRLSEVPEDVKDAINAQLQDIAKATPAERTEMVNKRFHEYRNLVQYRVPMPTAYDSIDKVLEDLFPLLVGDD